MHANWDVHYTQSSYCNGAGGTYCLFLAPSEWLDSHWTTDVFAKAKTSRWDIDYASFRAQYVYTNQHRNAQFLDQVEVA